MHRGSQLRAPLGYGSLVQDTDYYLLGRSSETNRAHLVRFMESIEENVRSDRWSAWFISLDGADFDSAVEQNLIHEIPKISPLPPWLSGYEGLSL